MGKSEWSKNRWPLASILKPLTTELCLKPMTMKRKAGWLFAAVSLFWLTGCDIERPKAKTYTVTAYAQNGQEIGKWEHATIVRSCAGWCIIELPTGKTVQIDGPHTWVEE
jgi:hypothetical protein